MAHTAHHNAYTSHHSLRTRAGSPTPHDLLPTPTAIDLDKLEKRKGIIIFHIKTLGSYSKCRNVALIPQEPIASIYEFFRICLGKERLSCFILPSEGSFATIQIAQRASNPVS